MLEEPCFHSDSPFADDYGGSYTDGGWDIKNRLQYGWKHALAETVMALINAGLVIDSLVAHKEMDWAPLPGMVVAKTATVACRKSGETLCH